MSDPETQPDSTPDDPGPSTESAEDIPSTEETVDAVPESSPEDSDSELLVDESSDHAEELKGVVIEKEEGPEPGAVAPPPIQHEFKVQMEIFEGPLDLLLYLIKKDELDIYDIKIEKITKQYLAFIETFKMLNINLAGEFLVMAANLCYIKSRMMLPKHVQPPEEDADEDDPRWDLIRQLIEYKKFKDAASFLGRRETEQSDLFAHRPDPIEVDKTQERPLAEVGIFDLIKAFQNILERFEDEGLGEIIDDRFTVSDKINYLLETVKPGETIKFAALFEGASTKNEVIVTFLALLELMKLNHFRVRQQMILGEIELERNKDF